MTDVEFDPRVTPWKIDDSRFTSLVTSRERAEFLTGYAVLAPSGHNTQPWKFALEEYGVSVYADNVRRLPVADPGDRELRMSVGAAIANLRVAAAHFGYASEVVYGRGTDSPEFLASVKLLEGGHVDEGLAALFPAITARRTNRFAYGDKRLSPSDREKLEAITKRFGASVTIVTDEGVKEKISDLILKGDRIRMSDKAFTKELADWVGANKGREDGITADALGIPGAFVGVARWAMKTFNTGNSTGKKDAALARAAAALVVVHGKDETESLLEAGQALEAFLLEAALLGMGCSFFNLAVEVPEPRADLKDVIGVDDLPQLLLRAGYADPPAVASPRRPLGAVVVN